MATVIWSDKLHRWMLRVQVDGQLKTFASRKAGIQGKKEVLKRYREWQENGTVDRSKFLANKVWDKFIEDKQNRLGDKSPSYDQYVWLGRTYILPKITNKRMMNLKKIDYQNIINNAKRQDNPEQPLSKDTLTALKKVLNMFIKFAVENDYCEPIKGELYIPAGHTIKGKDILQPDELKRLFEPSKLNYHKALCFMACTGLRPSECLGLKWSDIKNDVIYIQRGISVKGDITNGKNTNAKRMIPLASITKELLKIQKENTAHLKSEWIFCDKVGDHGNQGALSYELGALGKKRGFKISPYSLRHTYVSLMSNSVPEPLLKMIVGHSKTFQTYEVYNHLVNGEIQQAAKLTDITFNDIQKTGD